MSDFNLSQLVFIGFGMVAKSLLTLMFIKDALCVYETPVLIIEPNNLDDCLVIQRLKKAHPNVKIIQDKLTAINYKQIFNQHVKHNAVIIDLSWRVKTSDIINECQAKECLYVNTAIDEWHHTDMTLYDLKQHILKEVDNPKMTSVINHGMNPGMVSHITKAFLMMMAKKHNKTQLLKEKKYGQIAKEIGLTTIQIAERDTQLSNRHTTEKEFCNTWSVVGLIDESLLNAEISWGTHEKKMPLKADTSKLQESGQIILPIPCSQVRAKTFEPLGGLATGYCIAHAECYSLAKFLMLPDYRISSYYCYLIPDVAKTIAHYLDYCLDDEFMPEKYHILRSDEITSGYDSVGCLFYLREPELKIYWFGCAYTNDAIRKISPEINGTCMQVAVSLLACIEWMIGHPRQGLIEPEEVDTEYIIQNCQEHMGIFKCVNVTEECKKCGLVSDQFSDLVVVPKDILF